MDQIIRVEHSKNNPYIMIAKSTINDLKIDLQAKGFLYYLLTKPDNWRIRLDTLAKETKMNKVSVQRIINKLIRGGYVRREILKRRTPDGRFQTASFYWVFENKADAERFLPEKDQVIPFSRGAGINDAVIPF